MLRKFLIRSSCLWKKLVESTFIGNLGVPLYFFLFFFFFFFSHHLYVILLQMYTDFLQTKEKKDEHFVPKPQVYRLLSSPLLSLNLFHYPRQFPSLQTPKIFVHFIFKEAERKLAKSNGGLVRHILEYCVE